MLTYVDAVYDQNLLYIPLVFRGGSKGHISQCIASVCSLVKGLTALRLRLLSTCVCTEATVARTVGYSSHSRRRLMSRLLFRAIA
jgi:hypothetical protein